MKNLLLGAVAVAVLTVVGLAISPDVAKAGMWEKLSSLGDKSVPSVSFAIEAKGWNLRGYEFITPSGARCVAVTGTKKGGVSCDFTKDWNAK